MMLLLAIAAAWAEPLPRPTRAEPQPHDLDAQGFPDKVPFTDGSPVVITGSDDAPRMQPVEVHADAILVAPSYLAWLEKTAIWADAAELRVGAQAELLPAQVAVPVPWVRRPVPNLVAGFVGGVFTGVGIFILSQEVP